MTSHRYHVSESLFTSDIRKDFRRQSVAFSASRNTCWRRKTSFLTSSTRSSSNSSFTTPEPPIGKCENEVNDLENERVREQIAQLPIKDVIEDCLRVLFENDNDLILHMVVRVKENQNDVINIYNGEDPEKVVKLFAKKYGLGVSRE